jgi:arylsulfatase A-like enzyme
VLGVAIGVVVSVIEWMGSGVRRRVDRALREGPGVGNCVLLRSRASVFPGKSAIRLDRCAALALGAAVSFAIVTACGGGDTGSSEDGATQPSTVIHLVEQEAEFAGPTPSLPPEVARFDAVALEGWKRIAVPAGVRISSPALAIPIEKGLRLRLRLRPGGARRVELSPILEGQVEKRQNVLRTIVVGLEHDADPDVPVRIAVDLTESLLGNWDDFALQSEGPVTLRKFRVLLPEAALHRAALEELVFERSDVRLAAAAAATATIDRAGLLRPSWYLHPGARVRVGLEVPSAAELRWHEAANGAGAEVEVRLVEDGGSEELHSSAAGERWAHRSVSLARWAGRTVTLEFGVRGSDIAFVGDPRVIAGSTGRRAPDVLVYLIDTLRGDRIGVGGRDLPNLTPHMDRLAQTGVYFSNTLSSSSWTKPAIVTLMTGVWPTTHRVGALSYMDRLPEEVPILQQRFRDAGWRAGSFSASPLGSTLSALDRGFGTAAPPRYWAGSIGAFPHPTAEQLHEALLAWIDEEPDRPFFGYVQTLEVHSWAPPVIPPPRPPGYDRYDAMVHEADAALGNLLTGLRERGRTENLLVVVLSDHGESFGDHGATKHGSALYQSQVHIPLIFWAGDALTPHTVEHPVSLADVPATLLDYLGLAPLPDSAGISLVPHLRGEAEPVRNHAPASLLRALWVPDAPRQFSLLRSDMKKIIRWSDGRGAAYDLADDPLERRELKDPPGLATALDRWLAGQRRAAADFERRYGRDRAAEIDADEADRLRALGYLE